MINPFIYENDKDFKNLSQENVEKIDRWMKEFQEKKNLNKMDEKIILITGEGNSLKTSLAEYICKKYNFMPNLDLDIEVYEFVRACSKKDIRELIGSLFRVHLQAQLENKPLNNEFLAKEGWIQESQKEVITLDEIINLVEHNFGITRSDIISKSRKQAIVWARQVAMYLARRYTLLP